MKPAASLRAEPDPVAEAPDVIYLPDLSPPPPKSKGRHFGPRRAADPRTAWLPSVRCTPAFRAKVLAEAEAAGLSYGAFVQTKLGGSAGPRVRRNPGMDAVLLAKAVAALGKPGSNLNQIARQLNSDELAQLPDLAEAIAEHRAAVAALMRALGA